MSSGKRMKNRMKGGSGARLVVQRPQQQSGLTVSAPRRGSRLELGRPELELELGEGARSRGEGATLGEGQGSESGSGSVSSLGPGGGGDEELKNRHLPMFHYPNLIFFSLISPYVLLGFFLLLSLFNTNIKGIVFLIGVVIMIFFSSFVSKNVGGPESSVCNVFGDIGLLGKALPLSLLVYGFTFMYLLFPMVQNRMMNYPVLFSLLLLISSDISIKLKLECVNMKGIFVALSIATVSGIAWYILIQNIAPYLLYHVDYISDKQVCSMPSQQHFKCNVYKNGELISTMTE